MGSIAPKGIDFSQEPFWIQLHDLPFAGLNKSMGEKLGATIGRVMLVDADENGMRWGSFLRVKVLVDITKPLARVEFSALGISVSGSLFNTKDCPAFVSSVVLFNMVS